MLFKNLNKPKFNWFKVDEIRDIDTLADNEKNELHKFSFAPFTPSYFYTWLRDGWDFLILRIAISIILMIGYYVFLFSLSIANDVTSSQNFSGFSILVLVYLLLDFVIRLIQGKYTKLLSWNRLSWDDFESYEYSEQQWHIAGLAFFILEILAIVLLIVLFFVYRSMIL